MMLDRIETADPVDDDRIDGIKRIVRELVAATQPQNAPQNIPEIIPGWIPVSERLPFDEIVNLPKPMGGPFLVAYSSGAVDISWYSCRQGITGRRGEWDGETGTLAIAMGRGKVTHWMPLPNPPKEEK
ncbi:DUF551 domain-containing protein [Klebsiella pneumoniae]|uniref:DUF551 domain-containing protein n=1 Tax=Klebsiella pneumoniae TaxID=573 RepID=UPI003970BAEE